MNEDKTGRERNQLNAYPFPPLFWLQANRVKVEAGRLWATLVKKIERRLHLVRLVRPRETKLPKFRTARCWAIWWRTAGVV